VFAGATRLSRLNATRSECTEHSTVGAVLEQRD
jgi:hypothetical protein